jgi:hypothetical protein
VVKWWITCEALLDKKIISGKITCRTVVLVPLFPCINSAFLKVIWVAVKHNLESGDYINIIVLPEMELVDILAFV